MLALVTAMMDVGAVQAADWAGGFVDRYGIFGAVYLGMAGAIWLLWRRLGERDDAWAVERKEWTAKLTDLIEQGMKSNFELTTAVNGIRDLVRATAGQGGPR